MPITQCTATCDVLFILAAGRSELFSTLGLVAPNLAQSFQSCFLPELSPAFQKNIMEFESWSRLVPKKIQYVHA